MAPVTATGVPKPAAPSKKAPKEKAMNSSCSRRSGVRAAMLSRRTENSPASSVRRYRKITLRMIQPIGSSP